MVNSYTEKNKSGITVDDLRGFLDRVGKLGHPGDTFIRAEASAFKNLLTSIGVREGDTRGAAQVKGAPYATD